MKSFRNIRVIPVVTIAISSLAALKVAGLVIGGGYVFEHRFQPASQNRAESQGSWAQDMLNFPGGPKADPADVTGSVPGAPKEATTEEAPKPAAPATKSDSVIHPEENQNTVSPSERAILERLKSRRQELEQRAREIDIRESLLKAAEKRIESRVDEIKSIEAKASAANDPGCVKTRRRI